MVLADVIKRWQILKGNQAFLSTGTDEHGMKIQRAALREDIPPKQLCDENSKKFHDLASQGSVSYDDFIRTTDERHKEAVGHFYTTMRNGLQDTLGLYKGEHEGWYSVDDECFYPEDVVEPSIVPQTGKKINVSKETGSAVEWVKEETWFFPLTKYKDQLLKFFDENPGWIEPSFRMKEVRDWVENHLEDLSVTRPYSRLAWGIQDPEDNKQTIYVWVDALINYLTITGYGKDWHMQPPPRNLWPADLHIVGKDIIRFHAVYWPAMLMALNLPLPKKILCHNHWTMSNRKMSKSVGNVVNPTFAIQRWGVDPLRYFLMRNGSLLKDMGYSNEIIEMVYMKELQANIGNLYYRTCRPKNTRSWSSGDIVEKYKGNFEAYRNLDNPREASQHFSYLEPFIDACAGEVTKAMEEHNPAKAIDHIFNLMREVSAIKDGRVGERRIC
jgi:methionyl-tRNA synthetase